MSDRADERSRVLGGLVCLAALVAGALFLYGVLSGAYWALAIPVTIGTIFVIGLVAWIGWTIATVQVEAQGEPLGQSGGPSAPTRVEPATNEASKGQA
ncbi:MAG: hypothetical protein GY725_17005 [bacterium]|nr:hypothetical protein [bacterium]